MCNPKHIRIGLLPFIGLLLAVLPVHAQDLGQLGKQDPFTIQGALNGSLSAYASDLAEPHYTPLSWSLSGRLNIGLYGVQIPFSFIFSEKEREFRQPFNQYGLSPRYKWAKLHLGHRSMNFSELTMSGQRFLGAGVELNPGKFRFAAMYGKLRREIFVDTNTTEIETPAYDRNGWAVRVGVGNQRSHVDLILFRAWDIYDLEKMTTGRYGVLQPEDNMVLGTDVAFQLYKGLQFQLDAAGSLNNVGILPESGVRTTGEINTDFDTPLFNVDQRTRRGTAVRTGLSYNFRGITVSGKYDRIDPLFRTLGNYYFLTNIENYRGSVAWGMFKRRLRTSLSLGIQTNDLSRTYAARTKRKIGSVSVSYNNGKAYNLNFSLSNFEADIRSTYEAAGSDTLKLRQVSRNASLTQSLRFRNKETKRTRSFNLSLSQQSFLTDPNGTQEGQHTTSWTGRVGYRVRLGQQDLSWGTGLSGSLFGLGGDKRIKYGLSGNMRKGFLENKLGTHARLAFYRNQSSSGDSYSLIASTGFNLRVKRMHRFGLSLRYSNRKYAQDTGLGQYQLSAQLTYGISFKPRKTKTPTTP